MATTKIKQLESFDSGSNYSFGDKLDITGTPRSMFNLSHVQTGTVPGIGIIWPFKIIPTLPNDSYDITINSLLRALPSSVPLESRQRMYISAFYSRMGDLWCNFETFMKKGYSGNEILEIPCLEENKNISNSAIAARIQYGSKNYNSSWDTTKSILPNSLGESLGLPHSYKTATVGQVTLLKNDSDYHIFTDPTYNNREKISALPFMMWLRVWRDYYTNKNYWIDDRCILPNDDADFRMNDDGEVKSFKENNQKVLFDIASTAYGMQRTNNDLTVSLAYHEYAKDRWTSALPFLERGTPKGIEWEFNVGSAGKLGTFDSNDNPVATLLQYGNVVPGTGNLDGFQALGGDPATPKSFSNGDYLGIIPQDKKIKIDLFMRDIRGMAIEQTELEKMARTDGSYAEFGLTFFGIVSKNATDHKPVYIGGTYKEIVYTEVVQTSESGNTPMGSYVGHSTTGDSSYIGHIDCDDYGYIMLCACIMPDTIYSQGMEDHWTNLLQSQFYLPERAKIGMTNLLNKTIRFDYANTATALEDNNGLFAYQDYADEYRYMPNEIRGEIANGHNIEFWEYTQSRVFQSKPTWGRNFAEAKDVRNDYLAAATLPPFTYEFGMDIRAVRPIPYKNIPANLVGLR